MFCAACAPLNDAPNIVLKCSELEALRFAKIDTEARNDNQALQILDFRIRETRSRAELELAQLTTQKHQLQAAIEARKPVYLALVKELAEKYGIEDPSKMTIDTDTGVIRDLSKS